MNFNLSQDKVTFWWLWLLFFTPPPPPVFLVPDEVPLTSLFLDKAKNFSENLSYLSKLVLQRYELSKVENNIIYILGKTFKKLLALYPPEQQVNR